MPLNRDQVRALAALAHITLTEEECNAFASELDRILDYAERIQELDTGGIEPTSRALLERGLGGDGAALREDEPSPGLDRERVLEGAPDDGEGLFKVPKVLP